MRLEVSSEKSVSKPSSMRVNLFCSLAIKLKPVYLISMCFVPAGTMILKEGEVNLDMYKIVAGHVEMYTGYGTDNEVLIGILGPDTCFGEFGILTGRPAIYTIITYSDAKILRVTEGLMGDFIQENKDSILKIMKNMANNMMRMQHQIYQLSQELAEKNEEDTPDDAEYTILKDSIKNYALYDPDNPNNMMQGKMHFLNL